jgi:hypothetical protein
VLPSFERSSAQKALLRIVPPLETQSRAATEEDEAHGEIETLHAGYLGMQDT